MQLINDLKGQKLKFKKEIYSVWKNVHYRAGNLPHYEDVTVFDKWYTFSNFYYWSIPRYKKGWQLDKDIIDGNKRIYSPETCIYVPSEVNSLFRKFKNSTSYTGVYYDARSDRYYAQIKTLGMKYNAGGSDTAEGAHQLYMMARKEKYLSLSIKYSSNQELSELLKNLSKQ